MSGWIKVEKSLENDPRVLRMTAQLRNADVTLGKRATLLVIGAIVKLWWYADTHIRKDNQLDLGTSEIDDLIGLDGFCAMMPEDWLKVIDEKTVQLPDFQEHNGVEAKRRAVTQKRVSRFRNATKVTDSNAHVTQIALPDQTRPDQTRPEGKEGRAKRATSPYAFNETTLIALGVDEQSARDWLAVRKAKKAIFTQSALDDLKREAGKAGITVGEAVAICARRSWQGFNASWNWRDNNAAGNKQTALEERNRRVAEEASKEFANGNL